MPDSLAIIIPTLNAAGVLPALLEALRALPGAEVIVADGGSSDVTASIARGHGASVVESPRGRGVQLAAGAAAAQGAWLLFLHADSRPDAAAFAAVRAHIADAARAGRAGYFRFALDDPSAAARRLERAVAWRCRWLALPYGDQGLLIPRALYDAVGGFKPLPLMEDVDFVRRLGRARLVALDAALPTGAARFRRDGWRRRSARNLMLLALWFAGVPPRWLAKLY